MDVKKKILTGGMWLAAGTVITSILAYVFRFVLIKELSIEDYGLYYAIISIFLFATTLIELGRNPAIVKFASEQLAKSRKACVKYLIQYYLKFTAKLSILFIILVFAAADFLAKNYFKDPRAYWIFIVLGIFYALYVVLLNFISTLFIAFQDGKNHSMYDVFKIILQVVLLFVFLHQGFGIWSPIIAVTLGQLGASIVFYTVFVKKHFQGFFKLKSKPVPLGPVAGFAYASVLYSMGTYILNYTDTYMLTYFTDLAEVGLYNVAAPTARIVMFFSLAITLLIAPIASTLYAKKQKKVLSEVINMVYKIGLVFFLPMALVLISYPGLVLATLFSSEHAAAAMPLMILSISSIFALFFSINVNFFNGIGRPEINTKIIAAVAVLNVLLNFLLIPKWGMSGAAISTMTGYLIMCIASFIVIKRLNAISLRFDYFAKFALISTVFLASVHYLKLWIVIRNVWVEMFVVLSLAGIIYFGLVFLTRALTVNNIKDVVRLYAK
ncbi:flippase [Nanoarchaeota archaeon]